MKKKDVPQDTGIAEGLKEVCYAVDENGKYVLVPSAGWEPKNITNDQAWEVIREQLDITARRVAAEELSPLAYHMTRNLMDVNLLAEYMGIYRWRVKRHLRPEIFKRLKRPLLERYAKLLRVTVEELTDIKLIAATLADEKQGQK